MKFRTMKAHESFLFNMFVLEKWFFRLNISGPQKIDTHISSLITLV